MKALHPDIAQQVATNIANIEAGYEQPSAPVLEPLSIEALPPIEAFNYEEALKAMTPKNILDNMEKRPEYNDYFDIAKARQDLGDKGTINMLANRAASKRVEVAKATYKDMNSYTKGFTTSMANIAITVDDVLNALHLQDDETHNARVANLRQYIKDVASTDPSSDDFLSMFTLGRVVGDIVALPIGGQTKLGIFTVGAIAGYGESRGVGEGSVSSSLAMGAATGAVGVGIAKAIEALAEPAKKSVYNYYKDQFNISTKKADEIYDNYVKIMKPESSEYATRTMAIFEYAGNEAANLKKTFGTLHHTDTGKLNKPKIQRHEKLKELADVDFNIKDFSDKLHEGVDTIKQNYGVVKIELGKKYDGILLNHKPLELPDTPDVVAQVDGIVSDKYAVKELLGKDNAVLSDYIEAMPHINRMVRKEKGKKDWAKVKENVENIVASKMSKEDYSTWKAVNEDYSAMRQVLDSRLGKAITRATSNTSDNITIARALDLLKADKDGGDVTYKMLHDIVGTEQAVKFEKAAIKNILDVHSDDIEWSTFYNTAKTKGFTTAEGKNLLKLLKITADTFNTDNITTFLTSDKRNVGNRATTVDNKAAMSMLDYVFRKIKKYSPSKSGKAIRNEDKLFAILKSDKQVQDLSLDISRIQEPIKARYLNTLISEELPRLIENFDDTKKKYISTKADLEARKYLPIAAPEIIDEGLQQAFKDAMFSKLQHSEANKITDEVFKYFNTKSSQVQEITKSILQSRAKENTKALAKRTQALIKHEADILSKNISRDTGLKVDRDMYNELLTYVINKNADTLLAEYKFIPTEELYTSLYHTTKELKSFKNFSMDKAKSGMFGKALYVSKDKTTDLGKAKNTTISTTAPAKLKVIKLSHKEYQDMYMKVAQLYNVPVSEAKEIVNSSLQRQYKIDALETSTVGHKDILVIFNSAKVK